MVACNERTPCATWMDHHFTSPKFVENGQHPTMGRYQKHLVRCEHCGAETTETCWLDILDRPAFEPFEKGTRR